MVSIGAIIELAEAAEDAEITQQEAENIMTVIFSNAIAGTVLVFGMLMMIKIVGKSSPAVAVVEGVESIAGVAGLAGELVGVVK